MIFPLSTWSSHIYVDKVYCKHGDDEEPVHLIYTHHIKSLNNNNKRTNVRKIVLIAEQGIIRNNKPNQEEDGNKGVGDRVLTLHILSHRPDLIRRMYHNSLLVRLDMVFLFVHNMLHTRRISTNIMTRYQSLVFRTPALQHLDEVWQVTCIRAQT